MPPFYQYTPREAARYPTQHIDNFPLKQHTPSLRGDEGRDRLYGEGGDDRRSDPGARGRQTFGHSLVIDPWGDVLLDMRTTENPVSTARIAIGRPTYPCPTTATRIVHHPGTAVC